jgi:hypothetical protein
MEIIKPGNLQTTLKPKTFMCFNCGCVFMADCTEYEYAGMQYNQPYYKCLCPTCCKYVYTEE